jgi:hypothetical protein
MFLIHWEKRRRELGRVAVLSIFVLLSMAVGCAGEQDQASQEPTSSTEETSTEEASSEQTSSSSSDRTSQPAPAPSSETEPAPIELSGNGHTATDAFDLEDGLTIFKMSYQGEQNFIVNLLGEPGPYANGVLLANELGSFSGSEASQTHGGSHVLDVQASGPWTITIEQPRPTSAPETGSYEYQTGKTATDFFNLEQGSKRFDMTHQGNNYFSVWLLDKNGARLPGGLLANEVGPYEGSRAIQVPRDGIYLLQVEADGPWSVKVEGLNLGGR